MTDEEWVEWDDWDTVGSFGSEAGRAIPAAIAIFFLALLCLFIFVSSESDDCAVLAKKNNMAFHEYSLGKGCKIGPKP